jgi:hypothetical protein
MSWRAAETSPFGLSWQAADSVKIEFFIYKFFSFFFFFFLNYYFQNKIIII